MSYFGGWDWETPVLLGLGGILFLALFCLKFYTTPWCFVCSPLGFKRFCDSASQQASLSHLYFLGLHTGTSGWNPLKGNKPKSSKGAWQVRTPEGQNWQTSESDRLNKVGKKSQSTIPFKLRSPSSPTPILAPARDTILYLLLVRPVSYLSTNDGVFLG